MSDGLSARSAALKILDQVLQKKRPLDQVLESERAFYSLPGRERAFTRMLVSTVLRRKGQLDDLIRRAMNRGEEPRPETLRHILYIGITQLLFMDVPDHAAVDTSVSLAKAEGAERQKGFINAVLRRMISEGREWVKKQDPVQTNVPEWILKDWIATYGLIEAAEIAQGSLTEAPLDITVKDKGEIKLWEGALGASALPTGSLRRSGGGNVTELAGFADGSWWVQDASAALPARLFGDRKDKTVVDLCAAPGGKTMQLASMGANVIAVDRSTSRMKILFQNLDRTNLRARVETVIADGAEWKPQKPVDAVLLDAPCSATGTIRRHPDLLHLKTPKDIEQLCAIQGRLLDNAAGILQPGGTLIYCTCSLQKAEGEGQITSFLYRHPEFRRAPVKAGEIGNIEGAITLDGDVRLLPYHLAPHGGMDGFFISRLKKF
ncbi:MAG: 16S rRNA (cytosine(967)-C(5))-methyltransferase RsmB [Rhodospirillales bacterium]|nr:16S rRNA (cytosine(967)-C(5))-methyltransferase RsmB [Alphaproteobacteria bacterium]USO04591.1 MAG: 16S rRNA (cytosine(967)-C(5))-methyltransferase RsmB [Rhodospirillales bacterium]